MAAALLQLHVINILFSSLILWNSFDITPVNGFGILAPNYIDGVAINCGYFGNSTAVDGRIWFGDEGTKSAMSMLELRGNSKSLTGAHKTLTADPVPYLTARASATQFHYTFHVNPGQKFIRLHFYPSSYRPFESFQDIFTVRAGDFTLLRNFSVSLAADSLGVKYIVKEFCLNVEEGKYLNLTFSPSQGTKQKKFYAFVNGIEIISMPIGLYYTPDGELGVPVVGQRNRYYSIDNSTALEIVLRLNIGGSSILPVEDFGMFRSWGEDAKYLQTSELEPVNYLVRGIKFTSIPAFTAPLKIYQTSWRIMRKTWSADKMHNFTWKIQVDVGFGYLVRLHLCDFELEVINGGQREFSVVINNQVAKTVGDVIRLSGGTGVPIYSDYIVMVEEEKEAVKFDLLITLQSSDKLAIGLLHGMEIFKLSGLGNNLASPNPSLRRQVSFSWNIKIQNLVLAFGKKHAGATCMTVLISLLNIIVFRLRKNREEISRKGIASRSASSGQSSCHRFSLAEIISATRNFNDALLIGKGGFGKVYKGFIYGGSEIVAVKRLKSNSKQGAQEFWTEIETLSKIRHIHLVSLIGYCNDYQEMILVYEYMPSGTLADNLYKIGRNGKNGTPLNWEQRLKICIGAARGLDYLHTGIEYGVIHRDVKDTNILLDENLVAKISDFGLSKLGRVNESQSYVSTKVKGTFGYLDPEYCMTHKPTRKTDVYAFGIVMLVVLCGRPAVDPEEPHSLLYLFRECMTKGDFDDIVDPSLQGNISPESLKQFIKSVENCVHSQTKKRPTMSQVVTSLEYALGQHKGTARSSKSKGAVALGEPCTNGRTIQSFSVPPMHRERPKSMQKERISSTVNQNFELQGRGMEAQPIRKRSWFWHREVPWKKRKFFSKKQDLLPEDEQILGNYKNQDSLADALFSRVRFSQIQKATGNFRGDRLIMEDESWVVYMGFIQPLNEKYSIYKFKPMVSDGEMEDIIKEFDLLCQLRHPNLLSMTGYCCHESSVFVVYEYVGNTTLHWCLYERDVPFSWIDRIWICIGIAEGLKYLHNVTEKKIIHSFLTSESILFDTGAKNSPREWTPLLSIFGLLRFSNIAIRSLAWSSSLKSYAGGNMPLFEYLPPDCLIYGPQFTEKNDIYSFGLVLLEVLCRRKPNHNGSRSTDEMYLKTWVKRSIKARRLHHIIDSKLAGQISHTCLSEFLKIAFNCLHDEPTERPTMGYIVETLKYALHLQETDHNGHHDFEYVYQEIADLAEGVS